MRRFDPGPRLQTFPSKSLASLHLSRDSSFGLIGDEMAKMGLFCAQKRTKSGQKVTGVVENLLRMPEPKTRDEAVKIVAAAQQKHISRKRQQARKMATEPAKMSLEEFATGIVKNFEHRYRSSPRLQRDAEVQYILELVVSTTGSHIQKLGQYDRPALVPKPALKDAA